MIFTHSVMFHHFHNENHRPSQGSLSSLEFHKMLDWLSIRFNLIGAREYLAKFEKTELGNNDVCLSFDDGLLCQFDIAIPILEDRGLDAFFFSYSSAFTETPCNLEIFRYFRTNEFSSIDDFYNQFFELVENNFHSDLEKHRNIYLDLNYLNAFPFYTKNDKWFRYLRDQVLGVQNYEQVMMKLMGLKGFSKKNIADDLWMSEDNLEEISNLGHLVGLHSHSHPMQMSRLSYQDQYKEYKNNLDYLSAVIGDVVCMSHPCGDYNSETLTILEKLGIRIGFRSNTSEKIIKSKFEIPRNDQANVSKAMKQCSSVALF
jgi:peptidoglycan/xylan/chitin deacetylase (PgdA/CDA1 family)